MERIAGNTRELGRCKMRPLFMKPCIRIRFIASKSIFGWPIRFDTNGLFQHVEFGTPEGTWIGAHVEGGWQERPADYCKPWREYYYEIPCTQAVMDAHLRRIRARIGTKYNKLAIIGLLIRNRRLTSPHAVICSQGVTDEGLQIWGPKRFLNVADAYTHLVTPEMVYLSPVLAGNRVRAIG